MMNKDLRCTTYKSERGKKKSAFLFFLLLGIGVCVYLVFHDDLKFTMGTMKSVTINDDGIVLGSQTIKGDTIEDIVRQSGIHLRGEDSVWPELATRAVSGQTIFITRARQATVKIDRGERTILSREKMIGDAIASSGIILDEDDIVKPPRESYYTEGLAVVVTRVEIREEVTESGVPFDTKVIEDESLSWRKKITTQTGERGVRTMTYRVAYHDGKEISRKLLRTEMTKDPVTEQVTQGTFVKLGKKHEGGASWYAFTGTMAAANPWLPKGSYVKVTNLENGKSVIVVINDRGPFAPGRIIDLDKVAFAKIASIGAGVINVKMEEITN